MADDKKKARARAGAGEETLNGATGPIAAIPTWKKMLVICSLVMMAAGGVLSAAGALAGDSQPASVRSADGTGAAGGTGSANNLVSGFAPDGGGGDADGDASDESAAAGDQDEQGGGDWSPAMFKLGFSFFVGFAIAFALRTFVKISMIAIGMFFLVHFALEYYGFIQVNWDVFGDKYDSITDWLGRQTGGFKQFITGSLPSAASATTGLVLGFRKR